MKSTIITLTIFISVVVSDAAGKDKIKKGVEQSNTKLLLDVVVNPNKLEQSTTEANTSADTTEIVENTTTELLVDTTTEENIDVTTEQIYSTTPKIDVGCPEGQSNFTQQDLLQIISYFVNDMNTTKKINDSYYDKATHAADEILSQWNKFIVNFQTQPTHLSDVLQEMNSTRQLKIVPEVRTTVDSLQEFVTIEKDFDVLNNTTVDLLRNLEKYKKLCEYNCEVQLTKRTSSSLQTNAEVTAISHDGSMCSTIAEVTAQIINKLHSFVEDEIVIVNNIVNYDVQVLKRRIENLKTTLRSRSLAQFGITMFEILNLFDDHFHFLESLKEFNKESLTKAISKINVDVHYKLLDLVPKVAQYRRHCLECNQSVRRRRLAVDNDVTVIRLKQDTNLLDQLLDNKVQELDAVILADLNSIFRELSDLVNDDDLVDMEIANLIPVQEELSNQTKEEANALKELIQRVPKRDLDEVAAVFDRSQNLLSSIEKAKEFLDLY